MREHSSHPQEDHWLLGEGWTYTLIQLLNLGLLLNVTFSFPFCLFTVVKQMIPLLSCS